MRKTLSLAACALFLALEVIPAIAADLALIGTWQLNTEKSHFSHGELPAKLVLTIEPDGSDGIRYHSANMVAGRAGGAKWAAHFDGKGYPVTGTNDYDTVNIEKVNDHTVKLQMHKHGDLIVELTYAVAPDGKSLTRKGVSHKNGQDNHFDEWFDRQ